MSHNTTYVHISRLTKEKFGKPINPHLFRDCAATSIALEDPAHLATTIAVLGHTSLKTSERSYNHAVRRQACETYQSDIAQMLRQNRNQVSTARRRERPLNPIRFLSTAEED
jgi:integrase/recombinase XerD